MSWLTSKELENAILNYGDKHVNITFRGIYPLDALPQLDMKGPLFLIFNTDVENLQGQHWKAIHIDENQYGEVFDSLATPTSDRLIQFMNHHTKKWIQNSAAYQHPLSAQCGVYVLFYVTQRMYYDSLQQFCNSFTTNLATNEILMSNFYKSLTQ